MHQGLHSAGRRDGLISGHFGLDFSKYSPDEIVQNIEVSGIQGMFESIIHAMAARP